MRTCPDTLNCSPSSDFRSNVAVFTPNIGFALDHQLYAERCTAPACCLMQEIFMRANNDWILLWNRESAVNTMTQCYQDCSLRCKTSRITAREPHEEAAYTVMMYESSSLEYLTSVISRRFWCYSSTQWKSFCTYYIMLTSRLYELNEIIKCRPVLPRIIDRSQQLLPLSTTAITERWIRICIPEKLSQVKDRANESVTYVTKLRGTFQIWWSTGSIVQGPGAIPQRKWGAAAPGKHSIF